MSKYLCHAALGALIAVAAAQGKWLQAQEHFDEALACDDSDPSIFQTYGLHLLGSTGHLRRSLDVSMTGHRLAPGWLVSYVTLAVAHTLLEESDPAGLKSTYIEIVGQVLSGLEQVPVCVAYDVDGTRHDDIPMTQTGFHHARPLYEYLDGWWEDIATATSFAALPAASASNPSRRASFSKSSGCSGSSSSERLCTIRSRLSVRRRKS